MASVLHEGYLSKLGGGRLRQVWQNRYCVLAEGGLLHYYKTSLKKDLKGSIKVIGAQLKTALHKSDQTIVLTPDGARKSYVWKANREEEHKEWIEKLGSAAKFVAAPQLDVPIEATGDDFGAIDFVEDDLDDSDLEYAPEAKQPPAKSMRPPVETTAPARSVRVAPSPMKAMNVRRTHAASVMQTREYALSRVATGEVKEGFMTLLTAHDDSLDWNRRYFIIDNASLLKCYSSPQAKVGAPLQKLVLSGSETQLLSYDTYNRWAFALRDRFGEEWVVSCDGREALDEWVESIFAQGD